MEPRETTARAGAEEAGSQPRWTSDDTAFCLMTACCAAYALIAWFGITKLDACRAALHGSSAPALVLEADDPPPRYWDI